MIIDEVEIYVVGVVRDCEQSLFRQMQIFDTVLENFNSVKFFFVESDSSDSTVSILEKLKITRGNFDYHSYGTLSSKFPLRTERIAFCRNRYLKQLETWKYRNLQNAYVVMVDMDGVNLKLSRDGFQSCFSDWKFNWDVMTANQSAPYYDLWALRHKNWMPGDYWEYFHFLRSLGVDNSRSKFLSMTSKMLSIPENAHPIIVDSAFGGLAVYKYQIIKDAKYCGRDGSGLEVCEHVMFHQNLRANNAQIFINPKMINDSWNEHNSEIRFHRRARRFVIELFRRVF